MKFFIIIIYVQQIEILDVTSTVLLLKERTEKDDEDKENKKKVEKLF